MAGCPLLLPYLLEEQLGNSAGDASDLPLFPPVHCITFSRAGLAICENGAIVAFENLLDELLELALSKGFVLGGLGRDEVVAPKGFLQSSIGEGDLGLFGVEDQLGVVVALTPFVFEQGSHSNGSFDGARHLLLIK